MEKFKVGDKVKVDILKILKLQNELYDCCINEINDILWAINRQEFTVSDIIKNQISGDKIQLLELNIYIEDIFVKRVE